MNFVIEIREIGELRWRRCDGSESAFGRNVPNADWAGQKKGIKMSIINISHTFGNITNTSVSFGGNGDRLTFIGSSSCGVTANGTNQTVSLVNDSWMVVQNAPKSPLNLVIKGNDANITINDMYHNIHIVLDHQGPYTITNNTTGPIAGAFITTQHSSIFVMGITAATLAHDVTAVG